MQQFRDKWNWVVVMAWLLAGASILASIWMGWRFGFHSVPGLDTANHLTETTQVNTLVIMASVGQILVSLLFGFMFSMLNSIYQTTIDSLDTARKLLYEKR